MKKVNFLLMVVSVCLIVFALYNIFLNRYHAVIEDDIFLLAISFLILFIFFTKSKKRFYNYTITLNQLHFPNFERLMTSLKDKYDYEIDYDTISDNYVNIYLDNIRINCSLYDARIPKDILRDAKFYALGDYDKKAVLNHDCQLDLTLYFKKKCELTKKELEIFMFRMTSEILDLTNSVGVFNSKDYVLKNEEHKVFLKDFFIKKVANEEFEALK